jgi:hypothetical protein
MVPIRGVRVVSSTTTHQPDIRSVPPPTQLGGETDEPRSEEISALKLFAEEVPAPMARESLSVRLT